MEDINLNIDNTVKMIVIPGSRKRYWATHTVASLLKHVGDIKKFVQLQKDKKCNLLWIHLDNYGPEESYYKEVLFAAIQAAKEIGNIEIAVGLSRFFDSSTETSTMKNANAIWDTWEMEGVFRIEGKQAYMFYDYFADWASVNPIDNSKITFNQIELNKILKEKYGIFKKDWLLLANTFYPMSFDNQKTWFNEKTGANGIHTWDRSGFIDVKGPHITNLDKVLAEWLDVDGTVPFSAGMPMDMILRDNKYRASFGRKRNMVGGGWAGYGAFYASEPGFYSFGYPGVTKMVNEILNMRVEDRAMGIIGISTNDAAEYTQIGAMQDFVEGLRFLPLDPHAYKIGFNIPNPISDRSGVLDYLSPLADQFLNNQAAPTFSSNELFGWYMMHPKDVPFMPIVPAGALAAGFTTEEWPKTIYYKETPRIAGIKSIPNVDDIAVGAWLLQESYLMINDKLSPSTFQPGMACFQIPLGSFRGYPTYSIIAKDKVTVIKTGKGQQKITDLMFPGGHQILAQKIITS